MENAQLLSDVERLSRSYESLPPTTLRPALIAVTGLPGTGKSSFSARLAARTNVVVLESDALRKILFPTPAYSTGESTRLFQAIHGLIHRLLSAGRSVVLDATTLAESHRQELRHVAARAQARLIVVRVHAPRRIVRRRLDERLWSRREGPGAASDADWGTYLQMEGNVEKIRGRHYSVDTSGDFSRALDRIVDDLENGQIPRAREDGPVSHSRTATP